MTMKYLLLICVSLCLCPFSNGASDVITIDLSPYSPFNDTNQVYKQFYTLTDIVTELEIVNVGDDIGFFVIQVHSFGENLTLSYSSTINGNSTVRGYNIGLVYGYSDNAVTFSLQQQDFTKTTVLIAIILYDETYPIPGGCNLSFESEVAPFQVVSYTDEVVVVDSQAPSAYGVSCDYNHIQVDMYHVFLKEYNNNESHYFNGIISMLSVKDIIMHGRRVRNPDAFFQYRRLFNAYKGTGEVFAIVATYRNRSSAYVPAVSYACNLNRWNESCIGPVSDQWKFICAGLLIFGLFICFFGHKYFRCSLFLTGFTAGFLITYTSLTFTDKFSVEEITGASLLISILYGAVWIFVWWAFGVPVLSVNLSFILCGSLIASVAFYSGLADIYIYTNDINFWATFICMILAVLIIGTSFAPEAHIFSCSILGSYACITALNYYIGGNLQYIIINTYRRIVIDDFHKAVVDPPFQVIDLVHVILWAVLLSFSCYYQWREQRGKPPFPPNRNVLAPARVSERTPLLPPHTPQYV